MLKADFHIHTSEDPEDLIRYSATELIDMAYDKGYAVLSITNHNLDIWTPWLRDYAKERGIVLLPGMEATLDGRHVLLINFDASRLTSRSLSSLVHAASPESLIIAPHPFYPGTVTLGRRLLDNISLFHALEHSHFWCRQVDFNRRANEVARQYGLPVVGTSDAHQRRQFGTTWTEVDSEPCVEAVIHAVKKGRVRVRTSPLSLSMLVRINALMLWRNHVIQRIQRKKP